MKVKTSELTGSALGWASAIADKRQTRHEIGGSIEVRGRTESGDELPEDLDLWMFWYPQANWSQGGPLIDRERITIRYWTNVPTVHAYMPVEGSTWYEGETALIAAMRCFVASKLGDEVEVPEELA